MDYFLTGEVVTDEGDRVAVGQITLGTGHAPLAAARSAVAAHYDNTGISAADVNAGPDSIGIWVAGACRPGTTPDQIRALRASAPSGDWRRIGGRLRLMAVLAVNVPGYPVPRPRARVASGCQTALVAAGVIAPVAGGRRRPRTSRRYRAMADFLAAQVHAPHRHSEAADLAAEVHGVGEFGCNCGKRKARTSSSSTGGGVTASAAPQYEVIAPDGSTEQFSSLISARRAQREVRGRLKVL